MSIVDISIPITNQTVPYKEEWKNELSTIQSTLNGDSSTVYRLNICSHTGTYIETSQHKLNNQKTLDKVNLDRFFCKVKLIEVITSSDNLITLEKFKSALSEGSIQLADGDSLIIYTGWGARNYNDKNFIIDSPGFTRELTDYLSQFKFNLLAVDTPVIDNQSEPYNAVSKLFEKNTDLLLLAPLAIDLDLVKEKNYFLNALPLKLLDTSASPCRAVLIEIYD